MNIKKSAVFAAIMTFLFIISLTTTVFAASAPTQNGVYEVSVKMYHAQKDKTSMGDKYLVHTALLTVKDGQSTLTIATPESVSDMQFWYYKNGGVEGETVEVSPKSNVKIAGTTYQLAFEFPVVNGNEYVGVKFSAPVMPLSPSARIFIDYSSAKKVSDIGGTTTTKNDAIGSSSATNAVAKKPGSANSTKQAQGTYTTTGAIVTTTTPETTTETTTSQNETTGAEKSAVENKKENITEKTPKVNASSTKKRGNKILPIVIGVIASVAVICAVTVILLKKKASKD